MSSSESSASESSASDSDYSLSSDDSGAEDQCQGRVTSAEVNGMGSTLGRHWQNNQVQSKFVLYMCVLYNNI